MTKWKEIRVKDPSGGAWTWTFEFDVTYLDRKVAEPYLDNQEITSFKAYGQYMTEGWDIATNWAIDQLGRGWIDSGHGPNFLSFSVDSMVSSLSQIPEHQKFEIKKVLGLVSSTRKLVGWLTELDLSACTAHLSLQDEATGREKHGPRIRFRFDKSWQALMREAFRSEPGVDRAFVVTLDETKDVLPELIWASVEFSTGGES